MESALFVGLMSGTSLDGVDSALVDLSGARPEVLATGFQPFEPALGDDLLALQSRGANELDRAARAANALAHAYAAGVATVLRKTGISRAQVRAIGAHGQTVRHRPEAGYTIQLNNPALLAELTGIDVVADFRSRDVAAGGQGAPLAPAFHQAFFSAPGQARVVLNVGGIANVTLLEADGQVSGFDTGPGNVLMDMWCKRNKGTAFDAGGAWAASGTVNARLLAAMLAEPYLRRAAPKSTGRDLFNEAWLDARLAQPGQDPAIAPVDVQATLLELTARTIRDALGERRYETIHVCGGGAANSALLQRLAALAAGTRVLTTATLGVPPDWVEAVAFAWLAQQAISGSPANLPEVTGARGRRVLGSVSPA